jgi:hypothetical protein
MNRDTRLMRLGWFWWVGCRRTDGRSGHSYTCPLLMTLYGLFLKVVMRRNVGWYAYAHRWLAPGDEYEPASIIHDYGTHGAAISCPRRLWPLIGVEMRVRRRLLAALAVALLLALSPLAAQGVKPPSIPEAVDRIARALIRDGLFTEKVCTGSRDADACKEWEKELDALLGIEEWRTSPLYERAQFGDQLADRLARSGERMEKLLETVKDEEAVEAIKGEIEKLKGAR